MPGQRFVNTFAPQTPIGQGLQNIGLALFGGKTPRDQETEAALMESRLAAADAHRSTAQYNTARTGQVTAETNHFNASRTPDALAMDTSRATGIPLPTVRGAMSYLQTGGDRPLDVDDKVLRSITAFLPARSAAYADKTADPSQMAKANQTFLQNQGFMQALDNPSTAPTFGAANAALAGKPLFNTNGQGVVTNNFTGTINEGGQLAGVIRKLNTSRAGAADGQRTQSLAAAGTSNARTRQLDYETKTGVKFGPPVMVQDPQEGLVFTPPSAAIGRTPGFRPVADKPLTNSQIVYTQGPDGTVIPMTTQQAVDSGTAVVPQPRIVGGAGGAGGAGRPPREAKPLDLKAMDTALNNLLTEVGIADAADLDPAVRSRILREATPIFNATPGIGHQAAVWSAMNKIAPNGFDKDPAPMWGGKQVPKGVDRSTWANAPVVGAPVPPRRGTMNTTQQQQAGQQSAQPPAQPQAGQPAKLPTMQEFMDAARKANPGQSDEALRAYYVRKYGGA